MGLVCNVKVAKDIHIQGTDRLVWVQGTAAGYTSTIFLFYRKYTLRDKSSNNSKIFIVFEDLDTEVLGHQHA